MNAKIVGTVLLIASFTLLIVSSYLAETWMPLRIAGALALVLAVLVLGLTRREPTLLDLYRSFPVPLGAFIDRRITQDLSKYLVPALKEGEKLVQSGNANTIEIFVKLNELLKKFFCNKKIKSNKNNNDENNREANSANDNNDNYINNGKISSAAEKLCQRDFRDSRARDNWIERAKNMLNWIRTTRNFAAHGVYRPTPREALTAIQFALELLDAFTADECRKNECRLFVKCPDGSIVEVAVDNRVKWFDTIEVEGCKTSEGESYKVQLDSRLIEEHLEILFNKNSRRRNT